MRAVLSIIAAALVSVVTIAAARADEAPLVCELISPWRISPRISIPKSLGELYSEHVTADPVAVGTANDLITAARAELDVKGNRIKRAVRDDDPDFDYGLEYPKLVEEVHRVEKRLREDLRAISDGQATCETDRAECRKRCERFERAWRRTIFNTYPMQFSFDPRALFRDCKIDCGIEPFASMIESYELGLDNMGRAACVALRRKAESGDDALDLSDEDGQARIASANQEAIRREEDFHEFVHKQRAVFLEASPEAVKEKIIAVSAETFSHELRMESLDASVFLKEILAIDLTVEQRASILRMRQDSKKRMYESLRDATIVYLRKPYVRSDTNQEADSDSAAELYESLRFWRREHLEIKKAVLAMLTPGQRDAYERLPVLRAPRWTPESDFDDE